MLERFGDRRVDDYHWLRDRDDPAVTAHLEAENVHTSASLAHTSGLQDRLYTEIVARIQETDESAPVRRGATWYVTRTVEGRQYAMHARRPARDGADEVMLDENALAEGHDFFSLGNLALSPDQRLLAYATDVSGGERMTLRVRDLGSGHDLPDEIVDTYYGLAWAADNRTLFYLRPDAAMRPWQLWRHVLGEDPAGDTLVHQEDDERFFLGLGETRSRAFVMLAAQSKMTTEVRVLDATTPRDRFRVIAARRQGVEYAVDHHQHRFFITTNDSAPNFRLVEAPVDAPGPESWHEVIGNRDDVTLDGVEAFRHHLVLHERAEGLRRIRVMDLADMSIHTIEQPEPVYAALPGDNPEFDTTELRFEYSSLTTPRSTIDYDMQTRVRQVRKVMPVLGGYDPERFTTSRLWATAPDGTSVPISLVHRCDLPLDGSAPAVLYGYGAYEISVDPAFSSLRLSLLERGLVYAIAHVRGGGEMGRSWYESGRLLHKRNTFNDFCACAEHLVAAGYTAADRLVIRGGSAGGLLMGAALNLRPDLFAAVVAHVPFVDVLTTMLDETLPLTVTEWEEWGNPNEEEHYRYMRGYSPYDNLAAMRHPALLVTAGLNDPRVGYWEPAKWVARLRDVGEGDAPILLKTEMGAGHAGPSGRYSSWREEAMVFAFILDSVGIAG